MEVMILTIGVPLIYPILHRRSDTVKKSTFIICLSISVIFVVGMSVFFVMIQKDTSYATYDIIIKADERTSYSLIIPIPLNSNDDQPSELVKHLSIVNGSATFRVVDTPYGKALNLSGTGSVRVQSTIMKYIPYAYLSMATSIVDISKWNGAYNVSIYCYGASNTTIKLSLELYVWHDKENTAEMHCTEGSKSLSPGKNIIEIMFGKSNAP